MEYKYAQQVQVKKQQIPIKGRYASGQNNPHAKKNKYWYILRKAIVTYKNEKKNVIRMPKTQYNMTYKLPCIMFKLNYAIQIVLHTGECRVVSDCLLEVARLGGGSFLDLKGANRRKFRVVVFFLKPSRSILALIPSCLFFIGLQMH